MNKQERELLLTVTAANAVLLEMATTILKAIRTPNALDLVLFECADDAHNQMTAAVDAMPDDDA